MTALSCCGRMNSAVLLQAVTMLRTQYRMSGSIMNLANHLVYNGQLRCASVEVARAMLPLQLSAAQLAAMAPWLQRVRPAAIMHGCVVFVAVGRGGLLPVLARPFSRPCLV